LFFGTFLQGSEFLYQQFINRIFREVEVVFPYKFHIEILHFSVLALMVRKAVKPDQGDRQKSQFYQVPINPHRSIFFASSVLHDLCPQRSSRANHLYSNVLPSSIILPCRSAPYWGFRFFPTANGSPPRGWAPPWRDRCPTANPHPRPKGSLQNHPQNPGSWKRGGAGIRP